MSDRREHPGVAAQAGETLVHRLVVERDRLRAALAEHAVVAEYDCPGDTPEFCGMSCQLCFGLDRHEPDCLLADVPATARWRHLKRGSTCTEIGRAELQAADPVVEGATLVVYREADGKLWSRPEPEFEDGRFERIVGAAMSLSVVPGRGRTRWRACTGRGRLIRAAKWTGTAAGVAGAVIIAANLGAVSVGFVLFLVSSILWSLVGWAQREPSLIVLQATFTVINLLGIWRWGGV